MVILLFPIILSFPNKHEISNFHFDSFELLFLSNNNYTIIVVIIV